MLDDTNAKVNACSALAAELMSHPLAAATVAELLDAGNNIEATIPHTRSLMLYRKWNMQDTMDNNHTI